jgi:hypothetical protein
MTTTTNSQRAHDAWRHVHGARGPKPAPQTDREFRAGVERDARAAGIDPQVAAWLAREVGKAPPTESEIDRMPERMRAFLGVRMSRRPVNDGALSKIAALYGASALLPELSAVRLPLLTANALLRDATGSSPSITPAGIDNVRAQLLAIQYWSNQC